MIINFIKILGNNGMMDLLNIMMNEVEVLKYLILIFLYYVIGLGLFIVVMLGFFMNIISLVVFV